MSQEELEGGNTTGAMTHDYPFETYSKMNRGCQAARFKYSPQKHLQNGITYIAESLYQEPW